MDVDIGIITVLSGVYDQCTSGRGVVYTTTSRYSQPKTKELVSDILAPSQTVKVIYYNDPYLDAQFPPFITPTDPPHDDHLHVRLRCPPGMAGCKAQDPTAAGDGCGENLVWWLSPDRYKPPKGPIRLAPELKLADLPAACAGVLTAGPSGLPAEALKVTAPLPRLRPQTN